MVNKADQPGVELHPRRLRKARLATFVSFFQLGVMVFAWSTGTSSFRAQLGIDGVDGDSAYGMVALSIGIGCAIGCFSGGPIMDRLGARRVLSFCLVLFPLSLIPLAFVPGFGAAFACGLVMGVVRGAVDTASNVTVPRSTALIGSHPALPGVPWPGIPQPGSAGHLTRGVV
ncbi:MFS transporter [Saccharopolyspora rectivirgula]|uniref:MFS transporter n=1 Tax=Saccharopolyspora rectivirgula TaxID=28042 RepID=UPI0024094561|nr:MFS transporter [Saccharopolyspora rectivirgula]